MFKLPTLGGQSAHQTPKRPLPSLYNGGWSILLSHILALISRKVSYFDRSCLGWRYEQFERIKDNYAYINGTIYNRKIQKLRRSIHSRNV